MEKDAFALPIPFLILILVIVAGCTLPPAEKSQTTVATTSTPSLTRSYNYVSQATLFPTETIQTYSDPNSNGGNAIEILRRNYMDYSPIYQNTYSFVGDSSEEINIQVTKGPMLVNLGFNPVLIHSANLYNPDVCYADVTIRNLSSGNVVAEEGWGRYYTNVASKQLIVYGPGPYNITVQGREMKITLSIYSGDSPKLQ